MRVTILSFLCSFFILLLSQNVIAQEQSNPKKEHIIAGLEKLREVVFNENRDAVKLISWLDVLQKDDQYQITNFNRFLYDLKKNLNDQNGDYAQTRLILSKKYNSKFVDKLTNDELDLLARSFDIFLMTYNSMLKTSYPFQVNLDSRYITHSLFFDINSGDSILEFGFGIGLVGLQNCLTYDSLYFAFSPERSWVKHGIEEKVHKYQNYLDDEVVVKMSPNSRTAFEKEKFDKIIALDLFQSLDYKKKFLKSVKKSMDADSELIIGQAVYDGEEPMMKNRITKKRMLKYFRRADLEVVDELMIDCYYYVKLKLKQ